MPHPPTHLTRRRFAAHGAAWLAAPWLLPTTAAARLLRQPTFRRDPFGMGIASGDPDAQGIVLWTRLVPEPLAPDFGMPGDDVRVHWQVAADEGMREIVRQGETRALADRAHAVHVEVDGLAADRWYWYRFRAGDAESAIGRTRTLPPPTAEPQRLRLAVTCCQNWEQGLFTAYQQMAADAPDLLCHLGDYIYEYGAGRTGTVRRHHGDETESLDDYRRRYAQYRSDPLLQAMHACCPWLVTWDDHEVDNNYAGAISEQADVDPQQFLLRRANAYRAYYEMMPLRRRSLPKGPHLQLYRRASYGKLAELLVLDTRQYRTDQPNGDRRSPLNEAALSRDNSMLGAEQRRWLERSLRESRATWNVLAQQVMMAMVTPAQSARGEPHYSMDQWPGYAHERMALVRHLAERKVANPIVLSGDIHTNWCNELRIDDRRPETKVVATEFVATSLSSGGNGSDRGRGHDELLRNNPCVRFHNRQRGYLRCEVTPASWRTDYVVMDQVERPGGKASVRAAWVVERGDPRVQAG